MDQQIKGGSHHSVEKIIFETSEESSLFFTKLRKVFFNINTWDCLFNERTTFQVTDEDGEEYGNSPSVGSYVKIKIPGPANKLGDGFDWVRIRSIELKIQSAGDTICIELQPCCNPRGSKTVAHFYTEAARNYFMIKISGCEIEASVHGRNETPNLKNLSAQNTIRNWWVGNGGIFGLSKIHWEIWTTNILDEKYLDDCLAIK